MTGRGAPDGADALAVGFRRAAELTRQHGTTF